MIIDHFSKVRPYLKRLLPVVLLIFTAMGCSFSNSNPPQELRAIWVQCSAASTSQKADEMLDRVAQGGFNTVLFCVGSGVANYDSDLLTRLPYVTPQYDPLAYVVEQGHARGLKVQAWWSPGLIMTHGSLRDEHPEWDIASVEGIPDDFHWANFSLPEVRRFVGDVVLEIAENYDVDGVHLDYIRYPPPPPYSPIDCRDFFSPEDVPSTVQSVYQRLKTSKPDAQLTAAVMTGQGGSVNHLQNWADWLARKYIDQVIPMAYFSPDENDQLQRYVEEWQALPHFQRVVSGLSVAYSLSTGKTKTKTSEQLLVQIEVCREGGAMGFAIFDEESITTEILETLAADLE